MTQHDGYDREALSKYRMDTAKEDLKDAIANFNKNYVKTEIFPRETGHMISKVELIRHASDYDDFYVASKEETSETIESARNFLDRVDIYIDNRIKQSNQVSE
ncbi:MAG: HEPN domain-containing protein [Candidatus Weimeria sp.]